MGIASRWKKIAAERDQDLNPQGDDDKERQRKAIVEEKAINAGNSSRWFRRSQESETMLLRGYSPKPTRGFMREDVRI